MNWQWHEAPHLSRAIAFSWEAIQKEDSGLERERHQRPKRSSFRLHVALLRTPLRLAAKAYRCYRQIKGHISALLARA